MMNTKNYILNILKRDNVQCTGSKQMCQTGTSINTLAICLAVIIPVVIVILIVCFFIFKAYKRNQKEQLEDNDPDFNGDNIVLPDYNNINDNNINNYKNRNLNDSTDSFGNPFSEKSNNNFNQYNHPSQVQLNNNNIINNNNSFSNLNFQPYANNMSEFALPFGNSKEDLDRYSKNLGLDFHEFSYPVTKINSPPSRSGSQPNSRRNSFGSNSRILNDNNNIKSVSPTKLPSSLNLHIAADELDNNINNNDDHNKIEDDIENISNNHNKEINDKSTNENFTVPILDFENSDDESDIRSPFENNKIMNEKSIQNNIDNDDNDDNDDNNQTIESNQSPISSNSDEIVHMNSSHTTMDENNDKTHNPLDLEIETNPIQYNGEIPEIEDFDTPLSPEEEEQLNRMKSIYKVYFSRNGSKRVVRRRNENDDNEEAREYQGAAEEEEEKDDDDHENNKNNNKNIIPSGKSVSFYPEVSVNPIDSSNDNKNKNLLEVPQSDEQEENFRTSVSSSIYLPINENGFNNATAGQFAHQQLGNLMPKNNEPTSDYEQQYYQQNGYLPQDHQQYQQQQQQPQQQYYQEYAQQDPQQQYYQNDQQGYDQYNQQQYYQQYPQMYQQNPQQYTNYAANQRAQPYANMQKRLPELEKLPLPHQLNKRTSTLESFTNFSSDSHKNPVTMPAVPINQQFDPIDHVNWNGRSDSTAPSPSQIRSSIVMFNPVGLSNNKTFVSKGTAKERVREMNKYQNQIQTQNDGFIQPNSPVLNGPLYGFYENVVERPHGAENLIPRNGSQADLRRQMENANV